NVEFGRPQWVFATSTWAFAGSRLVAAYAQIGRWHLATIDLASGTRTDLAPEIAASEWMAANTTHVVAIAGSTTRPDRVVRITLATGVVETLREASPLKLDEAHVSKAEAIEFPTDGGLTAHAFYYPPRNAEFSAPA